MFKLLRYFAITSAVILVAVTILIFLVYRQTTIEEVLKSAEHGNTVLAQSLANAVWLNHADRLVPVSDEDIDGLAEQPETLYLGEVIDRLRMGLPVLKVKVFNAEGLVVYSTDPVDIGLKVDHNTEHFNSAQYGTTSSQFLHSNDPFSSTDQFPGRDVVETYLPVFGPDGDVRGVFELYADVTQRYTDIKAMGAALLGGLLVGSALLYGGLLLVVRRAGRIMERQYMSLRYSRERLKGKNRALAAEIRRRAEIEAELRETRDCAEAANRAKSQFLANMSHELRTPLNAVIGFSQVMVDETLGRVSPPRYREYAQDIQNSGRHLLALVNNVLDMAKVESGKMDVATNPFEIGNLVQDSVRDLKAQIAKNGNALRLDCPRNLGAMVSDEIKVRSVLINLVGNAAKFTRDGRIEIAVWREGGSGAGAACVVFRVSDTGIGMDEGRIEEMFEEFTQYDNSLTREFGGTGLGLAICRRICEALGGSIAIESNLGEGTAVTVRLPDCMAVCVDNTAAE